MEVTFENITHSTVLLSEFELGWRFNKVLTEDQQSKMKPLNKRGSEFLFEYLETNELHKEIPFKKDFFKYVEKIEIDDKKQVQIWLSKIGLNNEEVFLSWNKENGMIVPYKLLVENFDDFYYESSDDLTVFQKGLDWAILFFHAKQIYFGKDKIK